MAASYTIRENFHIELYGASGVAEDRNWGKTGMVLMDKMWKEVKTRQLPNKGINVWVYSPGNGLFAGVELLAPPPADLPLERKVVSIPRYAHYVHIGNYDTIGRTVGRLAEEFKREGIKTAWPYVEIYGHWTEDVSKLETEILWAIEP